MKQEELKEVLRLHKLWLEESPDGKQANLKGANLKWADLQGANLEGANIDYSCWPLWCGSLGVKGDAALVGQLLFHIFDLAKHSKIDISSMVKIQKTIDKGTPITKHHKENPLTKKKEQKRAT